MAMSAHWSLFHFPPKPQLLSLSSPCHPFISTFKPPTLLKRQRPPPYASTVRPCCSSAAIPPKEQCRWQEDYLKEELISAIGEELSSFVKEINGRVESLHEALTILDLIERLGIQRFFKQHIDQILESTFMQWDEKNGLMGANVTVLSFRLLRLHGYHVCGDVLKILRDKDDGSFSAFLASTSESSDKVSGLLNLYKCSQIGFPNESEIMDEAEDFSSSQLIKILSDEDSSQLLSNEQREEIQFALTYPVDIFYHDLKLEV